MNVCVWMGESDNCCTSPFIIYHGENPTFIIHYSNSTILTRTTKSDHVSTAKNCLSKSYNFIVCLLWPINCQLFQQQRHITSAPHVSARSVRLVFARIVTHWSVLDRTVFGNYDRCCCVLGRYKGQRGSCENMGVFDAERRRSHLSFFETMIQVELLHLTLRSASLLRCSVISPAGRYWHPRVSTGKSRVLSKEGNPSTSKCR